jgi:hypothetical protein
MAAVYIADLSYLLHCCSSHRGSADAYQQATLPSDGRASGGDGTRLPETVVTRLEKRKLSRAAPCANVPGKL